MNAATEKDSGRRTPPRHSVRGGRGRGDARGGRAPMGGRTLVDPAAAETAGRGVGRFARPMATTVHSGSGIPFGHVPAYLPGSASLVEDLDKRILIVLRDGKHLIGVSFPALKQRAISNSIQTTDRILFLNLSLIIIVLFSLKTLSSFDQFSNLVLLDTIERRIITVDEVSYFADIPLGIYIVRGDSMVLMGTIPEDSSMPNLQKVDLEKLQELETKADLALKWDFDIDLTA